MPERHWTTYKHPHYRQWEAKWETTRVHYEVDYDELETSRYLIKRAQGEADEQYEERIQTSDYLPLFGTLADAMVGRMMSAEDDVDRIWQEEDAAEGLGDTLDQSTTAGRLWRDATGEGENYLTMVQHAAVYLVTMHEVWGVVDGRRKVPDDLRTGTMEDIIGEATARVLSPLDVVNWREEDGRLVEVLVKHRVDARTSIMQETGEETRFRLYTLEGYQDFVEDEDSTSGANEVVPLPAVPYGEGGFRYWRTDKRREAILPIFRKVLPLKRKVGYIWAKKNGVLYNKESERDNILRIANTPGINVFADVTTWNEQIKPARESGSNVWLNDPQARHANHYITPDTGPAEIATTVLNDKKKDFFISAFRSYEDAVQGARTATEVMHASAGEESFLNTLAVALDAFENAVGHRWEQIYFPNRPDMWGQFKVDRPNDFMPMDAGDMPADLKARYFGDEPVPIGRTGRKVAALKIAEADGVEVDADEVEEEVGLGVRRRELGVRRDEEALEADRLFRAERDGVARRRQQIENRSIEEAALTTDGQAS